MDSSQLTSKYSVVQDSLCNDESLPTNVPCSNDAQHVFNSKRKQARQSFPWAYTRDWKAGDPILQRQQQQCTVCCKWFSHKINASGWKAHLRLHGITDNDNDSSTSSEKLLVQATLSCVCKPRFLTLVLEGFENAVVDYVVQGGVTLRAAGSERFKQSVVALTHGYEPPSTRTILRRIVELHRVLEPALAAFLCNLTVAISLTLDGWSNQNLKGFYVVTAHWVDVVTMKTKTILLTILDVKCGAGVGVCVETNLFEYLKRMGRDIVTCILNVTSNNGSDATNALVRLFKLVNIFVGYEHLRKCKHVRCADHFVQLVVLQALKLICQPTEQLRDGLVKMRCSKLIRQQYRIEALRSWLSSTKPTHVDLLTRWNSTHQTCDDAFRKRVVIDTIINQYRDDIGHGALKDSEWQVIASVSNFLCAPRQVMESLAADSKPTLDLVSLSIGMLIKHCNDNEQNLQEIHDALTVIPMKMKLQSYEQKLVQEPAIIAAYLNPQIPKPTDTSELMVVTEIVRNLMLRRFSAKSTRSQSRELPSEVSRNTLFSAMFQPQGVESGIGDEVDEYLLTGVVHASGFIDIMSWWSAWKDALPGILKVPVHQAAAATVILAEGEEKILDSIVQNLEEEQGGWNEEILEDDVIAMLHSQFSDLVFDAEHDFGFA